MRASTYIQYNEALKYREAVYQSTANGTPLNTFLTVNLEQLGTSPKKCSAQLRTSLQKLRKYLTRRGCQWYAVWVLEHSPKSKTHAHIIIHRNETLLKDWRLFRKLVCCAFEYPNPPKRTIKFKRLPRGATFSVNLHNVMRYTLKGIRPEVSHLLNLEYHPQGMIYGKRIGWTRGLLVKGKPLELDRDDRELKCDHDNREGENDDEQ